MTEVPSLQAELKAKEVQTHLLTVPFNRFPSKITGVIRANCALDLNQLAAQFGDDRSVHQVGSCQLVVGSVDLKGLKNQNYFAPRVEYRGYEKIRIKVYRSGGKHEWPVQFLGISADFQTALAIAHELADFIVSTLQGAMSWSEPTKYDIQAPSELYVVDWNGTHVGSSAAQASFHQALLCQSLQVDYAEDIRAGSMVVTSYSNPPKVTVNYGQAQGPLPTQPSGSLNIFCGTGSLQVLCGQGDSGEMAIGIMASTLQRHPDVLKQGANVPKKKRKTPASDENLPVQSRKRAAVTQIRKRVVPANRKTKVRQTPFAAPKAVADFNFIEFDPPPIDPPSTADPIQKLVQTELVAVDDLLTDGALMDELYGIFWGERTA